MKIAATFLVLLVVLIALSSALIQALDKEFPANSLITAMERANHEPA